MTDNEKNQILFMHFVMSLSHAGMMQLGKVMNPVTNKIEKNLAEAKSTIDMLVMLREKTKNNLDKNEEQFLASSISSLQLNYVDEVEAEKQKLDNQKPQESENKEPQN